MLFGSNVSIAVQDPSFPVILLLNIDSTLGRNDLDNTKLFYQILGIKNA